MCPRDKNEIASDREDLYELVYVLVISKVYVLFTNTTYSCTEIYDHHIYKTIGFNNGR